MSLATCRVLADSHVEGEMDFGRTRLVRRMRTANHWTRSSARTNRLQSGLRFAAALVPDGTPAAVVLIAPPLGKHDYSDFAAIESASSNRITNDFTLESARLHTWFDGLSGPKRLLQASADNHFFRGHEPWLVETVSAFLSEQA